jgi:hypothetical protein
MDLAKTSFDLTEGSSIKKSISDQPLEFDETDWEKLFEKKPVEVVVIHRNSTQNLIRKESNDGSEPEEEEKSDQVASLRSRSLKTIKRKKACSESKMISIQ